MDTLEMVMSVMSALVISASSLYLGPLWIARVDRAM